MMKRFRSRRIKVWLGVAAMAAGLSSPAAVAVTVTSPQQIGINDIYQLNPDNASGDEDTTCPKTDANDGAGGDNRFFQRHNVARAHLGGCPERYWYTSAFRMLCNGNPPVNTCGDGPCVDEPEPGAEQWVDYAPPFGAGANQLPAGRYLINAQYRYTDARPAYPALYIVNHDSGQAIVEQRQDQGTLNACESFDVGTFDLGPGSFIRVEDTGPESITFNRMRFTYKGPADGVPYVNAGSDLTIVLPNAATLNGAALDDDGAPGTLSATWSKVDGPGTVSFADDSSAATTATFSAEGTYTLRLTASDTQHVVTDDVVVTVLPAGSCQLEVTPGCAGTRQLSARVFSKSNPVQFPDAVIAPVEFTLTNSGGSPLDYTVEEVSNVSGATVTDHAWLTIVNPTGTIPPLSSVTVTVTFDKSAMPSATASDVATLNGFLRFSEPACVALPVITRLITVSVLGPDGTSVHVYHGDIDPTAPDSAGPPASGYNFAVEEGINQGSVEDDPDAVDGKAWRIIDSGSAKTKFRAARAAPLPDPTIFTRPGATVVGRVRVRSHADPRGGALMIWDNTHITADYHWAENGLDGVLTETFRGNTVILPGLFDQNYHILRLTAMGDADCNRTIRFYFDEDVNPAAVLTIENAPGVDAPANEGLGFGAGSTAGSYDIAFDWVSMTNVGAFAPGEEVGVIGQSLVIGKNCPTPYVDSDEDGDVDMTDFAAMQRCFNGLAGGFGSPLIEGCECYDNAGAKNVVDEFDVNYFVDCASGPDVAWTESVGCPK